MLYVSIFLELLRSRPALAVGFATLAQALLWFLIPTVFYSGPPGDLPYVLAVGHEFQLGSYLGPPLAFWLAELAFDVTGGRLFGVYALSQICVAVTYWAVFALASAIVGAQQAALAVLLMVGIAAFTVPTPDFGPVVLQGWLTSDVYEKNYGGKDVRGWVRVILPLNVAGAPFGPSAPATMVRGSR